MALINVGTCNLHCLIWHDNCLIWHKLDCGLQYTPLCWNLSHGSIWHELDWRVQVRKGWSGTCNIIQYDTSLTVDYSTLHPFFFCHGFSDKTVWALQLEFVYEFDVSTYSATNSTWAAEKTNTLKFKEIFSFLIGLQATKARLHCCKHALWLADQCWVAPVEFVALFSNKCCKH